MSAESSKEAAGTNPRRKQSRLKWFYMFAGANTVFMQCTIAGSLFALYMNELGLNPARIGVLISLFPFMQTVSLISTPTVERIGFKRSFLLFYGSRKLTVMAMALAPWILGFWGEGATFCFIAACIILFGLQRSLGETALYPWRKDFIPDHVRGRVGGIANMVSMIAAGTGLYIASLVVEHGGEWGLGNTGAFQLAYVAFPLVGILGVLGMGRLPRAESPATEHGKPFTSRLWQALKDRRLVRFLCGAGIMQGSLPLFAGFMPLFMKHEVGISSGSIVRLTIAQMAGGFAAGYLSGRAADRFGSRPVIITLLIALATMPVFWVWMPLLSGWQLIAGMTVYFLFGAALFGTRIAEMRMMYNTVVPEERKSEYLAIRYSLVGIIAGCIPLFAGQSVNLFSDLEGTLLGVPLTPYTPLFAIAAVAWITAIFLLGGIEEEPATDAN